MSGVLAAVTIGIVLGWAAPEISTASMRLTGYAVWEIIMFLLNALLFVLIGLQLPTILEGPAGRAAGTLLGWAAAVSAAVILTRLVFAAAVHALHPARRPARGPARAPRRRGGSASSTPGAACAARCRWPPRSRSRADFPHRDIVLFLTFAVIFATLVLQGLTLPPLIKALRVEDDGADEREELIGRRAAAEAALAQLDELGEAEWTRDDTAERMRELYEYRQRRFAIRAGELEDGDGTDAVETRSQRYQKMVRSVLDRAAPAARRAAQLAARSPTTS